MANGKRTVFLDRDGTVSIDRGYTCRPEDMRIYPGAGRAVARLKEAGFQVAIVTNQSAIGRGMASAEAVERTNDECLRQLLEEAPAAKVDWVAYCPHSPEDNCECRKPKTGMVNNLPWAPATSESWLVGDKFSDLRFGLNLGIPPQQCLLVLTGDGKAELDQCRGMIGPALRIAADLTEAAAIIGSSGRTDETED